MKPCDVCGGVLFYDNGRCRKCQNKYDKEYYQKNSTNILERTALRRKLNIDKYREREKVQKLKHGRRQWLQKNYGITLQQYELLYNSQLGHCAICKRHQSEFKKNLAVDHCHVTNKIRGLLCSQCNQAIGLFKENIVSIENAIEYLKKPR